MITVKIDWLSLSAKTALPLTVNDFTAETIARFVSHSFSTIGLTVTSAAVTRGRGAARWGLSWLDGAIQLFAGDESGWVAIEFSGRGCQHLRDVGHLETWTNALEWRVTRLDVAVDTDTANAAQIAATVGTTRFKTTSEMHSISGDTFYFGSQKSDRMLRVYQYHPPHPRAAIARVEFVVRDKAARQLAAAISANGLPACAAELARKFGVVSPALSGLAEAKALTGFAVSERHKTGKYRWVLSQALPGLASAVSDGIITREAIMRRLDDLIGQGRAGGD